LTVALRSCREPLDVQRERRDYYRWWETEKSVEFGAVFRHQATGEVESYAHLAPTALEAQQQLELDLPGYSKNHMIRRALADALEQRALPQARQQQYGIKYVMRCAAQLRAARWSGAVGYSLAKSKSVVFWDQKAGLSRLCPDDAREEAQRLSRRVLGPLEELQADSHALHYCVFTTPNAAAGGLRKEMRSINRRFRSLILKSDQFPEIKGALCVLEAPLGGSRDWNVHLNVILVVKGFLDYGKLRRIWHWDVHAQKLAVGPGVVRGALCELIKYAVAATVAKSADKAVCGDQAGEGDAGSISARGPGGPGGAASPPRVSAPPMLEWTGAELLEWLLAMRGFRRTRTYGCLFRLKRPKAEDLGQIVWLGRVDYAGGGYRLSSRLLDSIPEDKSSGLSGVAAYVAMLRGLALPGIKGAGTLGQSIPRDVLHTLDENPIDL